MPQQVLSIQSAVAYGHVGNSGAAFALQRLGIGVCRLDTVMFSNHPAHGGFRGEPVPAALLRTVLTGLEERNFLGRCEAVLSGYLGSPAAGEVTIDAVGRLRRARTGALYCCDPVMGDRPQGLYVAAELPALFRDRLVPLADIVAPNAFELELLTGMPAGSQAEALAAARALLGRGPSLVLVTGLAEGDGIGALAVRREAAWLARCPRVETPAWGAGDVFTAIFLGRYLEKADPARALSLAVSSLHALMLATAEANADELALIGAQDAVPAPPRLFAAERVA